MTRYAALVIGASLVAATPVGANDTTAELRTGGIVPIQSDAIEMVAEDLFLSMDEVRVDYLFRNRTDAPVAATIAFPMPDIASGEDVNVALPRRDDNFLGFTVTMAGAPVTPTLHQRALANGVDVTGELVAARAPLNPYADAVEAALDALPAAQAQDWTRRGLIRIDEFDGDGKGIRAHRLPGWTLRSHYVWRAEFPVGVEVAVSHRYTPSLGTTAGLNFYWDQSFQNPHAGDYRARYCLDPGFEAALPRLAAETQPNEYRLDYVLATGANWAGGRIGRFTLTVDKGDPGNLVSFCGAGIEKISPTRFSMSARDVRPQDDLRVLFVGRRDAR